MHPFRTLIFTFLFMAIPLIAGCSALELFAPHKVESALLKIQQRYSALLDKSIEYHQQGLVSDKTEAALTKLMDRFESGYERVEQARADSQNEAANLDQYIRLELTTAGLTELHDEYLQAKQQALDQSDGDSASQLTALRALNQAKRLTWDRLVEN